MNAATLEVKPKRKRGEPDPNWPKYGIPGHEIQPDPRQCYGTPPAFMKWTIDLFGPRDLDVCAIRENAKCEAFIGPPGYKVLDIPGGPNMVGTDGLSTPWIVPGRARARVWCNPGFGNVAPWLEKAYQEAVDNGTHSLVLTHLSTDGWYHEAFRKCFRLWTPYPRLDFVPLEGIEVSDSNPSGCWLWEFSPLISGACDKLQVTPFWEKPPKPAKGPRTKSANPQAVDLFT